MRSGKYFFTSGGRSTLPTPTAAKITAVEPRRVNASTASARATSPTDATTIAATATESYADGNPGTSALSGAALTHGYEVAYYVLAAVTALAAVVSALMLEPAPKAGRAPSADEVVEPEPA